MQHNTVSIHSSIYSKHYFDMNKLITFYTILFFSTFLSTRVMAENEPLSLECIQTLQQQAKIDGLSELVINDIIPNLKYLSKVIKSDRSQAEFTETFATYLKKRVTTSRIKEGKKLFKKHQRFLESLTRQYGVPGRYLVAFWGLETNFGHYLGNISILNSLATLACDTRRSEFFTAELIQALKLIERESLIPEKMKGSWAGAMGQTQFMPSTYYKYAVDGDGDGKINLWLSEKDALASGANYLNQLGWKTGERWGRQVKLPSGFQYENSGYKNWESLKVWKSKGVKTVHDHLLADVDIQSAILVPLGYSGPAFLVYHNFNIIMNWNRSKHYALSVGLLADRIGGLGPLNSMPDNQTQLKVKTVFNLQKKLNESGFNAGTPDGIMGSMTQEAIQAFQVSSGLVADGYPDGITIKKLLN